MLKIHLGGVGHNALYADETFISKMVMIIHIPFELKCPFTEFAESAQLRVSRSILNL